MPLFIYSFMVEVLLDIAKGAQRVLKPASASKTKFATSKRRATSSFDLHMESKRSYPDDFREALTNKLTDVELEAMPKPPLFVYNYLILPSVLDYILKPVNDEEPSNLANSMTPSSSLILTQATLIDHKLYGFGGMEQNSEMKEHALPVAAAENFTGAFIDGMLIFGLNPLQRGLVNEFEMDQGMQLQNVRVELCLDDGELRTMDAAAFVWTGEMSNMDPYDKPAWSVDAFLEGKIYQSIMRRMGNAAANSLESSIEL